MVCMLREGESSQGGGIRGRGRGGGVRVVCHLVD